MLKFLQKIKANLELNKELGPLGLLMLFAIIAPGLGAMLLLSSSGVWFPRLQDLNQWTLPVYILLTVGLAGLSLIPTHASSLIGGILFGFIEGPIYSLCAVVGASYFAFLLVGCLVKESSYEALLKRPRVAKMHEELLIKSGIKAVLFIALVRLSPVMPFAGTNVLLAASNVKTYSFLLGSFIGMAPRVILVAIAGASLTKLDFSKSSSVDLVVLGGVATLLLIFYIGYIFKKVNGKLSLEINESVENFR